MSDDRQLWGNGGLTVAARLMSAVGVPAAAVVLGWIGLEIWGELKAIREQRISTVVALSAIDARLGGIEKRDDAQDRRLDDLLARLFDGRRDGR